ncbi:SDR family oxidoreductase [candidate division KSB1 bacterium]|nr:SDR family oxidoreductase [candidate division KSB1 bacterium]
MFDHKTALITGATGGAGQHVVEAFLRAGARVVANARNESSLQEMRLSLAAFGDRLFTHAADVTDEQAVKKLFARIDTDFHSLDILIHLAGGFQAGKSVAETGFVEWRHMMSLNLESAFLCTREAMSRMTAQGYGKIVLTAALAAMSPKAKRAAYAVSKAGVITLMQMLAVEGKPHGIQVNCIAPSIIRTDANAQAMPNADHSSWVAPERLARTLLFLCTADADDVSGSIVELPGRI